jgi:glutamate-1-semialdehyde 2,1-aminomutase
MENHLKRLLKVIPGGAHTYSKGHDQFPINAPQILKRGNGVYVFDNNNSKFLDYGMGLRSVGIGYNEKSIIKSALLGMKLGNNLTKPTILELEAAEKFLKIFKRADLVKFTKNGSSAVTAAVKIARAYNNKKIILRCADHPFFSFDDWFIGSTNVRRGIPLEVTNLTKMFKYNDIESLKKNIKKYKNKISCVVLEPASLTCPTLKENITHFDCCSSYPCQFNFYKSQNFLKNVESVCKNNDIVFILDEMITGFRWHIEGAQKVFDVNPDLSTFGKSIANGFSVSAVCGKKKYMDLGSITEKGKERLFLLSSTHGAEMSSLSAFSATSDFYRSHNVIEHIWEYGSKLILEANKISKSLDLLDYFYFKGPACLPYYITKNSKYENSLQFKTLFMQEMIKNKILMPWVSIAYHHNQRELNLTLKAIEKSLYIYKKAIKYGAKRYLSGPVVKPVFRKFN